MLIADKHTHTCHFNHHFPGEPGLTDSPLILSVQEFAAELLLNLRRTTAKLAV